MENYGITHERISDYGLGNFFVLKLPPVQTSLKIALKGKIRLCLPEIK